MEGKRLRTPFGTVLLGILILCLVIAQTKVEAKVCCQGNLGRFCNKACYWTQPKWYDCVKLCGCKDVSGNCPPGYDYDYPSISPLKNSAGTINEYCQEGCASSACKTIISTLQNSGAQVMKEVMDRCNNACYELCTKGSIALETA
ncbi:Thionin [Thalictrum thalictroides]|uniref:Thionin n=1 Tax=Thalictrum thalictroides TaxID=46969 RepID=A0A7J6WXG2_THATH|nr:Thionin [Thalictrum thalictroides]